MAGSTGRFEDLRARLRHPEEVWQAGFIPAPGAWVDREERRHVWALVIVSGPEERKILGPDATPDDLGAVLSLFERFAGDDASGGALPGRIQVRDAALARALAEFCDELGIALEEPRELALLEAVREEVAEDAPWVLQPALGDSAGASPETLRSFADAAATYQRARPWMLFGPDDLIRVGSPPSRFPWVLVEREALVLFEGSEDLEDRIAGAPRRPYCELRFGGEESVAAADHDAWKELDLPLADADSWPTATVFAPGEPPQAPEGPLLAWLAGLLRALAVSRDEEVSAGAWSPDVPTRDGRAVYELELPELVEVMEDLAAEELSEVAEERAAELVIQARLSGGRSRIHLAREALRAVLDEPEALLVLAEECRDPELRAARYAEALKASERRPSLETDAAAADAPEELVPARLRARHGLALALEEIGREEAALEHLETLAKLDPEDRLEVFETTLTLLLSMDRDEEARQLLGRHRGHPSSVSYYGAVLVARRLESDSPLPRVLLQRAVAFNPFVPRLLLAERDGAIAPYALAALQEEAYDAAQGRVEIYGLPFEASPEQRALPHLMDAANEALACTQYLGPAWSSTPGALEWLAAQAEPAED